MDIRVDNRRVLVTGGTGSIGTALVKIFSENGGKVSFQYNTDEESARRLENEYGARAIKMDFSSADFLIPESDFDILVNNAGVNYSAVLTQNVPIEQWEESLKVNLTAPFRMIKAYLPNMVKNKWGRIVNISSVWGLRGLARTLGYGVTKHGISGLTKIVAKEYAHYGVTCNEVCPGTTESKLTNMTFTRFGKEYGISKEEALRRRIDAIPAKRLAKPIEIAQLVLYLSSDQASYINGASIVIDGAFIS